MRKRYEIQACDLEEVKSKHKIVWHEITTAWTMKGALRKFGQVMDHSREYPVVVRVFDRKIGKVVA